jgi:catechol-2,3-dioxygenase
VTNPSVRHIGIVVQDLEGGIKFWNKNFGFNIRVNNFESGEFISNLLDIPHVKVQTVKLENGMGSEIELLKFSDYAGSTTWVGNITTTGLTHIALNVVDIEELVKRMKGQGYATYCDVQLNVERSAKVCYLVGFEGLLLELVEILVEN